MKNSFSSALISWSSDYVRELPWTKTYHPYHIWLREVILQQTRVAQGASYYEKFLKVYPEIHDLANADLEEIYKNWEGLGYYSRARNLHETAKTIVEKYGGEFPKKYEEIIQLKGIGAYTASAIMSFAYKKPYAVVDGNVYRVLSRYFGASIPIDTGEGKKYFKNLAQECIDEERPDVYNQAIIDFGAEICKPIVPNCNHCVFSSDCKALETDSIAQLPVKSKKMIKKARYFNYLVFCNEDKILVQKRNKKDIWQSLYQFPLIESEGDLLSTHELNSQKSISTEPVFESKEFKQALTHRNIFGKFFEFSSPPETIDKDWIWIEKKDIFNYSFPKIIRVYLTERYNCII